MNFVDLNATNYSWIESFIFSSKCLAMAMSVIVLKLCRISTFISRRLGLDTVLGISRNLDKILETTDSRTKNNKILRNTLSVFFHSFFISFLFKNSSFTNIYHANSFDPISSAINLAASRNKIDTFCCQHGGQSESNPYFCEWSLDFCIDSNIFCTTYLCWDESSSKSILGWKLNGSPPNIIITGNKWLAHTKELVFSSPSFIDSTESDLSYFNVVVTLQPSFVISDKVFEAFLNYSSKIKLWIRFHPAMNEKDQHYIHDFAKSNVRVEIEKSTEYSLSELLQVADLHLTASSSSIYEAISAGVYTVFVSENACSYFADFISQGHASYLANPEEIKEFLGSIDI